MSLALCAVLVLAGYSGAHAQSAANSGQISGQVLDPSGGAVVDTTVTIRNVDTNYSREVKTDGEGRFAAGPLPLGTYDVTIAASSDTPVTVLSAGKVSASRLVVHGGSVTAADLDALLDRPIIPIAVTQLGQIDNPQS